MKSIKSVGVTSFLTYGALLAGLVTVIYGLYYWLLGWVFGAQSWWIDMNLVNWTAYTATTFAMVFVRALIAAVGGALTGLVAALVYNSVAAMMGGIKVNLE